jgi:hypothetical protein
MIPIIYASLEKSVGKTAAVMVNGTVLFTITGGPVKIITLLSVCITANDATASTLQWQSNPTVGTATTISAASAALTSATAGTTVLLNQTSLATAPTIVAASAGGVQIGPNIANQIIIQQGTLTSVIGAGSTTGTWRHYMRYQPLHPDAVVN